MIVNFLLLVTLTILVSAQFETDEVRVSRAIYVNEKQGQELVQITNFTQIKRDSEILVVESSHSNQTTIEENGRDFTKRDNPTTNELGGGFVELYDELARLKNHSLTALIRLNYFGNNNRNTNGHHKNPLDWTHQHSGSDFDSFNLANKNRSSTYNPISNSNNNWINTDNHLNNVVAIKSNNPITEVALHFWTIFARLDARLRTFLMSLTNPLVKKSRGSVDGEVEDDGATFMCLSDGSLGDVRKTSGRLMKRETGGGEANSRYKSINQQCIGLDYNQADKCQSSEALVNINLNNSFPATIAAIEETCQHTTYLLNNCWPEQLSRLKESLSSWNSTNLLQTDFQLAQTISANEGSRVKCGVMPQVANNVLERIHWMWLNLCMDKKFRQDYVDNLKCLSLWTQERAQYVCNSDFRRMQTNLVSMDSTSIVGKQTSNSVSSNQSTRPSGDNSEMRNLTQSSDSLDKELESKALCCVFDIFLRCVHKQAVKDCGRSGGQFVVNFMSRIGTDDMKYLCNNEPRMNQKSRQPYGNRRNPNEKSPFIEVSYCSDTRIQHILHVAAASDHLSTERSKYYNSNPKQTNNRNNNLDPSKINYDPAFFNTMSSETYNRATTRSNLQVYTLLLGILYSWCMYLTR